MISLNEASGLRGRLKVCDGNLSLLREKLATDPDSYAEEFNEQFEHFQRLLKLLELQPVLHSSSIDTVVQLCNFLSLTATYYPEKASLLGSLVLHMLSSSGANVDQLGSELRCALCKCVVRLAMARLLDLHKVVTLFFDLLRCADKALRKFILGALIHFIRRCTKKRRMKRGGAKRRPKMAMVRQQNSQKLRQTLFGMLTDERTVCARVAQLALICAYRRHYWRNANIANALAECVFHQVQRIQISAMRFFLGSQRDEKPNEDGQNSSDDEMEGGEEGSRKETKSLKEVLQKFRHAKKTRKRKKNLDQAKKVIVTAQHKKEEKRRPKDMKQCNMEAINAIYDPQSFVDRLFSTLEGRQRNEKYAIRLLQIALCARVIGVHQLQTLGFYSYLHRYIRPKQKEVTRILLYAAQACHPLVPSDVIEQLIRVVAQNFVSDRNTPEAITVGLNTIREIYKGCPEAATEEMVRDLAAYKKTHNKNVSLAAHALIMLFRTINPKLLHHKDRGRPEKATDENNEMDVDNDDDDEMYEAGKASSNGEESSADENESDNEQHGHGGLPRLSDIEHFYGKFRRQTKEERMDQVKEGRPGKEAYGRPIRGPHVGRTNRELAKRKPVQMIRQKVRGRNRQRSFRDRQKSLRAYLLRQQGKKVK
ncbi:hypothetical protein niasHT_019942 [Heterodera trifolii]|uniref:Protein SDA1 n=1 Tax=Heterodera trifolii TaxID=157864 RepID=A0ABD2LA44_9BILA